ncbi:MAG: PHA/PHB synthase family protein [Leptothrix sp. (in: b-proteobacteria)]
MLAPRSLTSSTTRPDPAADPALIAAAFDRSVHAAVARLTSGLSPISLGLAWHDWAQHLLSQPGQALRLAAQAQAGAVEWLANSASPDHVSDTSSDDARFAAPEWQQWPWTSWVAGYQQAEHWWQDATALQGLTPHHSEVVRAFARQYLDMLSPSNLPFNPEVLKATQQRLGANLLDGMHNAIDDWRARQGLAPMTPPEHPYRPCVDLALTPGAVVYRNRLVELIQYSPATDTVQAEPVFIVPSWIMKYYILDLSAHNSMVRWLVSQGHTVFILSWHNPTELDAEVGLNDYLQWGIFDSLAAIHRLIPDQPVHACGYCLGGTLLAIAAAALARPQQVANAAQQAPLASVSLLASETDFTEPGELGILIDESQVDLLEAVMAERGFLTGRQMAGSFQFLHSRELVWSTRMREYLLGQRSQPNDLMAWNADVTRMPARMHSEYLRRCYLKNEIAEGRYGVEGRPVSLSDIRVPVFAVGTEKDHVSPWHSVYKLHRLTETELTFVLASGGHNAGIISEPGHAHRHYRLLTTAATDPWLAPSEWQAAATRHEGSWWTAWHDWLSARSSGQVPARQIDPASMLDAAPGRYVQERYND